MTTYFEKINILSKGFDDLIDITQKVKNVVLSSNIQAGIVNIQVVSSCASVVVLDNVDGLGYDLSKMLQEIVSINKVYQYDNNWQEGNAFSHLRALLMKNNTTLALIDNKIQLSENQRILFIDFDNKATSKQIIVSIVG